MTTSFMERTNGLYGELWPSKLDKLNPSLRVRWDQYKGTDESPPTPPAPLNDEIIACLKSEDESFNQDPRHIALPRLIDGQFTLISDDTLRQLSIDPARVTTLLDANALGYSSFPTDPTFSLPDGIAAPASGDSVSQLPDVSVAQTISEKPTQKISIPSAKAWTGVVVAVVAVFVLYAWKSSAPS